MSQSRKHTISNHFFRSHLLNGLRQGIDEQALLDHSKISKSVIEQPDARVSPYQLAKLMIKIMRDSDDEYMGLGSHICRLGVFNLLSERLILCDTLGEALNNAMRFHNLTNNSMSMRIETHGEDIHMSIDVRESDNDPDDLLPEFLMLAWHRFPSWLIGENIPLKAAYFNYSKPTDEDEYKLLFPCSQHFDQPSNTLVWPAKYLNMAIQRTPAQLQRYQGQTPLQWFRKAQFAEFHTEKVIQILERAPHPHKLTLEQAAAQLNVSSRTLRRRLTDEDSMFQQLKDNIQRERAIHLLSQNDLSINEVSEKTGYGETASFIRAFKNWTEMSPGQYRKQLRKPSK